MACQARNGYYNRVTSEIDQTQTLRLFVEHTKRELDPQRPDQMPAHRQTGPKYEVEVETEVPIEVSRYVPSEMSEAGGYDLLDSRGTVRD